MDEDIDSDLGDSDEETEDEDEDGDEISQELRKYIDLKLSKKKMSAELKAWKSDPSLFWALNKNEFKILSRLWRRIGSVKGASASAERIFSLSGFLLMARRWNMDPETLTCIVLLHNWGK